MENLDTKPILDLIREDAKKNADKLIADAQERAMDILEKSRHNISLWKEETKAKAEADADLLADRMQRLSALEDRKLLLSARRQILDQAFSQVLSELHALPREQVSQEILVMILANAQGDETLEAGQLNDSFFTRDFVKLANDGLIAKGKPGNLTMGEQRVPGVCGVVLKSRNSQVYCTFESLLDSKREQLEGPVAQILFPVEGT